MPCWSVCTVRFSRRSTPACFPSFPAAAEQTDIFRIQRPDGRWTLDEVV